MTAVPATYKNRPRPLARRDDGFAGTFGILTAERGTYASFWNDAHKTHMAMGLHSDKPTFMDVRMGVDICGALNGMIRTLRGDWLWIMGDDHAFDHELLPRLLSHDVDVVVPHCLRRNPPWQPVVNSHQDDDGWQVAAALPENDLTEIWSAGSAGMLIRRRVFDAISDPWFTPSADAAGLNEDINFCRKVREAGFQLWCDPAALLGHISHYTVYPKWQDGSWHLETVYDQNTRIPIRRLAEEVA